MSSGLIKQLMARFQKAESLLSMLSICLKQVLRKSAIYDTKARLMLNTLKMI